jgi:hypothetical protein
VAQITTGARQSRADGAPIVLLLGCDTAVAERELQSFVAQFRENGAALVVGTIAAVLGQHAAPVAQALARALHEAAAGQEDATFGVVMRDIRRKLVADGQLMSLCLAAYGDADWRLAAGVTCSGSRCCRPSRATPCGSSTATPERPTASWVDGGTSPTAPVIAERVARLAPDDRRFELLIVTHIDTDHIGGVLRLLDDDLGLEFGDVWFNAWRHLETVQADRLGPVDGEILSVLLDASGWPWNQAFGSGPAVVAARGAASPGTTSPAGCG